MKSEKDISVQRYESTKPSVVKGRSMSCRKRHLIIFATFILQCAVFATEGTNPAAVAVDLTMSSVTRDLMETNTFEVTIPSSAVASAYKIEIKSSGGTTWHQLGTQKKMEAFVQRVAGKFKLRGSATISGVEKSSGEKDLEVRFPNATTIAADTAVETARAADWTAASGVGGDHNERGAYIYLDTKTGSYSVSKWPVGTFFICNPSGSPTADGTSADLIAGVSYYLGEYHHHATLRDANDVKNAANFPKGPSSGDTNAANGTGAPGLLRERHADEIVETGHTDYTYGPDRKATPK